MNKQRAGQGPIIMMVNGETREQFARATGRKGLGDDGEMEWSVADMAEELWGHSGSEATEMIRRSDGEASIKTVKDVVARRQGGRVSLELAAEEAGKTVGELVRRNRLEEKARSECNAGSLITQWMIRWAAMCVSRCTIGTDGKTAYERRRGRGCEIPVALFGEWGHVQGDTEERQE